MSPNKIKNYRWLIVALLFLATTINYIDRQIIGLLKPLLEKEFNWSETDYAHIVMAFTTAYAAGLLFFGWLVDRIGTRMGFVISVISWSIAAMLHAVAKSVTGFMTARFGLGVAEAGNFPAGMKSIAEWFPKKERGLAAGFFNAGTSIGVIVALLIVPLILNYYGWREVFRITGSLGFIWLIFWLRFYDVPSRQKRLSDEERNYILTELSKENDNSKSSHKIKWEKLFLFPQTWAVITGKGLIDPIFWFFLFWLPSYFSSAFSLDLKKPSLQLMVIYAATTIGTIGGGYVSSLLIRKGWPVIKARKTVLIVIAVLELSIILLQFAKDAWIAVSLMSFAVAIHQAWSTNIFTMASDMFPIEAVSSVVGIAGMAGAVGGILFPIVIGSLLDTYKAAGNITAGYYLIFTLCGFTYLIAWTIIHFLTRKTERVALSQLN